ncbi:sigma-54 interaction domain-containing protein [Sporofaciens sp. SGI.106]|uniref:sigma-54 interaction domain-containing protein n=1 Tax=Sporofaciens sp. SGI.106 TaxID=3420568 RepID=UPI003D010C07
MGTSEKQHLREQFHLDTKNKKFRQALDFCERVADTHANILLTGESGSGKEVAAKYIHACGHRSNQNFVAVNCSAFTETLLESELFGHEQGSFTGASKAREGKFELSNHGTLFLDEIGDLSLTTQIKLLRALETKQIERIGSNKKREIDFQLITATNQDLPAKIERREFREDFFYRISTIVIRIPALRERKEDLPAFIDFFMKKAQKENNITIHSIDSSAEKFLMQYDYPGNIRELKNIIERMVILSDHGVITEESLPILYNIGTLKYAQKTPYFSEILPWKEYKAASEKAYLKWVLEQLDGNVAEASRRLGITSRQIFNKIQEYQLK